jgi:hypothetical protein
MTEHTVTDQRVTDETSLRARLADFPAAQSAPVEHTPPAPDSSGTSPSCSAASFFAPASTPWWRIGDFGVLGVWIVVVSFTLRYHEKWGDEAQSWLIARDLDLRTIWFHELRYEGSPGLWHTILWVAQHVFHAKYGAIGYIGMAGATAGVALLIFKAPFPRIIRWPLAFTYVMVYQYAVIARQYTLLPLLVFAAALLFKNIRHPERMTLVLVLLANLTVHGTALAVCFGLSYLIEGVRSWHRLEARVRTRYQICVAVMALTFLFLFIILKPTPDVDVFLRNKQTAQLPADIQMQIATEQLTAFISGAFFDYLVPSVLFVVLVGAWCFVRGRFLTFVLPVGALIVLYSFVQGYPHHHGTLFIAVIAALWIAWPDEQERHRLGIRERWAAHGIVVLLLCLCAVNIWDSAVVIRHEYLYPYSGAEDAAKYLKSVGADRGPVIGFSYGMAGIQAYFDHNILANTPTAYFHHGVPLYGLTVNVDELHRVNPEYVVAYSNNPDEMLQLIIPQFNAQGYEVVHFSDGYYLYKRIAFRREAYLVLRRTHPNPGPAPAQAQN